MRLKVVTRFTGLRPTIDPSTYTTVFTHVPKTGGTTLDQIMQVVTAITRRRGRRLRFSREELPPLEARNQEFLNLNLVTDDQIADCEYVSGHFPFGIHRRLPRPCLYVTLLRDPVARLLSNVRYGLDRRRWTRDSSVDALIEQGRLIDNLQTRQIAGVADSDAPCTTATLSMAIENLRSRYAIVGVTERFDDTLKGVITLFGWPDIAYTDRQVSKAPSDPDLEARVRHAAERYFALDMELHAYARARPSPWSPDVMEGTVVGSTRQASVLLTTPRLRIGNSQVALVPSAYFDSQICSAILRAGGEVRVV